MVDLERLMLLSGARRGIDDGSNDYQEEWIVSDEALRSIVCSLIHKAIDHQRLANWQFDSHGLLDFKNNGIKWTQN